jgi:hypothetical protein
MTERDGGKERFAIFIPIDIKVSDTHIHLQSYGLASDRETAEQAAIEMSAEFGAESWSLQEISRLNGKEIGDKKFFFSGATWKAPWQPTGPRPNWITRADPTQPIN